MSSAMKVQTNDLNFIVFHQMTLLLLIVFEIPSHPKCAPHMVLLFPLVACWLLASTCSRKVNPSDGVYFSNLKCFY